MQARKVGLLDFDFAATIHLATTFGYQIAIGRSVVETPADLAKLQIENAALLMADEVITQSKTIADWIIRHQDVPAGQIRAAPPLWADAPEGTGPKTRRTEPHILFAGTLTETKGIVTAVHVLRRLEDVYGISAYPIFSGHTDADFPAFEFLASELGREGPNFELLRPMEHQDFLKRLVDTDLVVVPSRLDENPIVVQECEALGIPVIMAASGDFSAESANRSDTITVVAHDHIAISDKASEMILADSQIPATDTINAAIADRRHAWNSFAESLSIDPKDRSQDHSDVNSTADAPLVSVCVAHHNRPQFLKLTLESIVKQTYPNIEIIVVDDGSKPANAKAAEDIVAGVENATLIKTDNRYSGAARNTAAEQANGVFLLFKDDDNYGKPNEVEIFVKSALTTGADILSCFSDNFLGEGRPDAEALWGVRRMPFCPGLGFNLYRNGIGDTNCLVKIEAWQELGGFTEHYRIGLDDHEFFLRAYLQGFSIELVPEALYYYRLGERKTKRMNLSKRADEQRIMSTLIEHSDHSLLDIASFYLARNLSNKG
ncbi:glycosyltransferase [Parasphingopyxis sp. CP4]|uniref:glycosyltransferase n=1 Tax=Parasphingopyxis sp. CP4 TaxID=2724527 RepID=UPI0015A433E1|nr:glycosyltransferase [Parasphingopyxis sp. CP4]QLC20914.1 glycosyltransferase [Parasphingopyxis sp. CP4]